MHRERENVRYKNKLCIIDRWVRIPFLLHLVKETEKEINKNNTGNFSFYSLGHVYCVCIAFRNHDALQIVQTPHLLLNWWFYYLCFGLLAYPSKSNEFRNWANADSRLAVKRTNREEKFDWFLETRAHPMNNNKNYFLLNVPHWSSKQRRHSIPSFYLPKLKPSMKISFCLFALH